MTESERRRLVAYVVRDLARLTDDLRELGLPATAQALGALTAAVAVSTTGYETKG